MKFENLFEKEVTTTGISGFFSAYGSFGVVDGADRDVNKTKCERNKFTADYDDFSAVCEYEEFENGVYSRQDYFTAKKELILNRYTSRFYLEGGEYEVYTQYSSWHKESLGGWQPLVTGCEIANMGIRTTEGVTPMAAIRNKATGKTLVFHLMPNAQWKINILKMPLDHKWDCVVIETGINDKGLALKCAEGEVIEMPRIFFFEVENTIDFDAWKLHTVYNRLYPRKVLPILFNTWLVNFDTINVEQIYKEAECAAELGVEQFLVDAGWFGTSDSWEKDIGDWKENQNGGFYGKVNELAEYVRSLGMKFGIWLEPERALTNTESYKSHPEYYKLGSRGSAFIDFANDEAREYITNIAVSLIEKYGCRFMKFDFNDNLTYDESGDGFYRYFKGTKKFVEEIRAKYPDIYITNCASGGNRMDLYQGTIYDSIWSSDNQSPIGGFRIFKDTALRMPPCHIEKWDVRRFFEGFPKYANKELVTLPISCNGATWENVCTVKAEYTHNFMTGGPMGFSTDIASYPDEEKKALKAHIAKFKKDREFYKNATLRVIYDSQDITAIQYSDTELKKVVIQIFCNVVNQRTVTVYPVLNKNTKYILNSEEVFANTICEDGIKTLVEDISAYTYELTAKE